MIDNITSTIHLPVGRLIIEMESKCIDAQECIFYILSPTEKLLHFDIMY